MDSFLKELKRIEKQLKEQRLKSIREQLAYEFELEDRKRLGLTGQAAIDHYNKWMANRHMEHLIVK